MADVLKAFAVSAVVVVALSVAGWFLLVRSLHRANRVVATRRCRAPLAWLWSWRQPARLHRRLRRAVQAATAAVAHLEHQCNPEQRVSGPSRRRRPGSFSATPLHDVAGDLVQRAAAVDDCVVAACRLGRPWAQHRMGELTAEVREVEALAFRLVQLSGQWRSSLDQAVQPALPPPDLRERLDAVEAALQELPSGV
jgi:hypothetical protein